MKKITFTVTNDLTYDQRMQRICTSLVNADYSVLLIGRKTDRSKPLKKEIFSQKRLHCYFSSGKLFYAEYNLRLLLFLFFIKMDCCCAIDLDTILPNYAVSFLQKKKRVYDAHELFTEQKEIVTRPAVRKMWLAIERFAVPRFQQGYTVNEFIVDELQKRYNVDYDMIRNLPRLNEAENKATAQEPFIIYQGAVNEGRSFETLIPAMKMVNAKLVICGDGNFFGQLKQLIADNNVAHKVELKGMVAPGKLRSITPQASAAIMLFENTGLNQYQSLANRFFDYIMAGVPQVCVSYPQYKTINDRYHVACMIDNTNAETIAATLNKLLQDSVYNETLRRNCKAARKELNWENEEKILLNFYKNLFAHSSALPAHGRE